MLKGMLTVLIVNMLLIMFMIFNVCKIDSRVPKVIVVSEYDPFSNYLQEKFKMLKTTADAWATIIVPSAKRYDIDPKIISTIGHLESGFRPGSVSYKKTSNGKDKTEEYALGQFQIKPSTAKWLCDEMGISFKDEMLYDPIFSAKLCSYYVKKLLILMDGSLEATVKSYYAGPANYRKKIGKKDQDKRWRDFCEIYNK